MANVTFAGASGMTNATNQAATTTSFVNVGGCTCTASSFAQATFTGTLVITGSEGNVDVTISSIPFAMGQVSTDQSGRFAHADVFWNLFLNGVSVFSNDMLIEVTGPNQTGQFQLGPVDISKPFSLQFGAVNTIEVRISAVSADVNEVPEPATIVLLISGLGFMTGVLKKRRDG